MSSIEAQRQVRVERARRALYRFLWEAMWEGEPGPTPTVPMSIGRTTDRIILDDLHEILGIRKPWWKRLLGL